MEPEKISEYMREIGKKGGASLFKKRGPEYYSKISKLGWKRKKLQKNKTKSNEKNKRKRLRDNGVAQ